MNGWSCHNQAIEIGARGCVGENMRKAATAVGIREDHLGNSSEMLVGKLYFPQSGFIGGVEEVIGYSKMWNRWHQSNQDHCHSFSCCSPSLR